jgi:hypothetical protein
MMMMMMITMDVCVLCVCCVCVNQPLGQQQRTGPAHVHDAAGSLSQHGHKHDVGPVQTSWRRRKGLGLFYEATASDDICWETSYTLQDTLTTQCNCKAFDWRRA